MKLKSLSDSVISILASPEMYPAPGSITFISLSLPFEKIGVKTHPVPEVEIMSTSGIDV